eukprot:s1330_g26.t2
MHEVLHEDSCELEYCKTDDQAADIFTKALPPQKWGPALKLLGVRVDLPDDLSKLREGAAPSRPKATWPKLLVLHHQQGRPDEILKTFADQMALLGGKRHMARIEDITLKDSKEPTMPLQETDDLFGALSQGELQEVMRVVRKRVLPKGALEALESKTSIADLDFDTMPLVGLSDKPQVEEDDDLQIEGEGDVMPMDLEAALEDEAATPAAAHTSPVPMAPQVEAMTG